MIKQNLKAIILALFFLWEISCTGRVGDKQPQPEKPAAEQSKLEMPQEESSARGKGHVRARVRERRGWNIDLIELSEEEKKVVEIETTKVSYRSVRPQLQAMGKVLAPHTRMALVSYAFPARIAEIHVKLGDWVKAGDRLVTLQSEEVGTAKSEFFKALADYELAKRSYEREKRLFDRGAGAQKNLLAAEAELKVAEANLNTKEKKLHLLGFNEEEIKVIAEVHQINPVITLFAPVKGKIVEIKAIPGAMIDQSREILTIIDPTVLWVDAEIFEKDIAKISTGQQVEISVHSYPEERFFGRISYIGDVLKEDTRTVTVRTEVENRDFRLKPGMFANMKIYLYAESKALVLPEQAILDDRGEKLVFIRVGNQFRPQKVAVGTKEEGYWEILSGLKEGDEVVTKGNYQLKSKLYGEVLKKAGVH